MPSQHQRAIRHGSAMIIGAAGMGLLIGLLGGACYGAMHGAVYGLIRGQPGQILVLGIMFAAAGALVGEVIGAASGYLARRESLSLPGKTKRRAG